MERMGTLSELPSVHNHRLNHNPSKLPSYRVSDLLSGPLQTPVRTEHEPAPPAPPVFEPAHNNNPPNEHQQVTVQQQQQQPQNKHARNQSDSATTSPSQSSLPLARPFTSPSFPGFATPSASIQSIKPRKGVPASHSRNGLRDSVNWTGPPPSFPPSMLDNTSDWVAEQAQAQATTAPIISIPTPVGIPPKDSAQQPSIPPLTPLIPPIRAFRATRRSAEIRASPVQRSSMDHKGSEDETLRALEAFDRVGPQRSSNREQEEQNSDDSDLFLKLAREEAPVNNPLGRGPIRRSQIDRQSLPPSSTTFQSSTSRRRGSDQESASGSRPTYEPGIMPQALTYRPSARDRVAPLDDLNRSRYYGANSRSTPTTPRALGSREISPESQVSYGGRRPSVPDSVLPARAGSYRQSNLSFSTPRTYNSSPLVSRTAEVHDTPEPPRAAEGTESTVSTTAPSTVWDELEDLKSRIHRLELTGKLPATSGAAISRASNDRPPTATTTVTTISSSPKRGRGNSISPIDSVEPPPADVHPLLHSALAKSKSLLSPEVYKALETAASDALAIAAMMGTSGQPGPISSSQSTVGGGSGPVSDRQVRRKADSMCRSLTELCLALSEAKNEPAQVPNNQVALRPSSRDEQSITNLEVNKHQRPSVSADLTRVQSSPRALSRLEARRSSLLATSSLPSPRYAPSEVGTPTQSSMAGRRTSLLLRSRRAGTEEPEEDDETRFRAPSRANTDIGRTRNSPREYTSQQPMPDNRPSGIPSALPRRHYVSTSLTNTPPPVLALPNLGSRRYLDRAAPERDTASVVGRMADDRPQRKSSIGQGFPLGRTGSLTRRTRQPNGEAQGATQQAGYQ